MKTYLNNSSNQMNMKSVFREKEMTRQPDKHDQKMIADFKMRFFLSLTVTLPILLLSPAVQSFLHLGELMYLKGSEYALLLLSTIVFFYGGWPFLKGIVRELKQNAPGMMTLAAIAIAVAYLYSVAVVIGLPGEIFFWELAALIDVMLFGHWVEKKSVALVGHSLEELVKLLPAKAHKIMADNKIKDIALNKLKIRDVVLVKPGEKIPADGKIIKGHTTIDESLLTGESNPVNKEVNSYVIGGSVNGQGAIEVEINQIGESSFIYQIMRLVLDAQNSKLQTKDFADKAAFWLTMVALSVSTFTLFSWIFFSTNSFSFALERAVSVLVIACPHALGLAIPLVMAMSTSLASKKGLLIRNWTAFEKAKDTNVVLFDKTGTLTKSKFGITNVVVLDKSFDERMILCYASAVEKYSEHPIAQAIFKSVCENTEVQNFKALTGEGVEGDVEGRNVKVVSQEYLKEVHKEVTNKELTKFSEEGKTIVFVLVDEEVVGAIAMSDTLKEESVKIIKKIKAMGIKTVMLTGDSEKSASYVAKKLGVDDYFFSVTPEEKVKKVEELQAKKMTVAVVGDGVNDAQALAVADIGIAIGAGTGVAAETSDIILVKNNLFDVVFAFKLSKASYNKMRQNLIWVTGYNIFMIPLAAGAFNSFGIIVNPAIGALLMSISAALVAVNVKLLRV